MKIGIDPGITGAIAVLGYMDELLQVHDMPIELINKKNHVDGWALSQIFTDLDYDEIDEVYLEKVHAMPNQGVTSMFNFGMGFGKIMGVMDALHLDYKLVSPQKWKKSADLVGKEKDAARLLALELYPDASLMRKKDIGRADAILIARYGGD